VGYIKHDSVLVVVGDYMIGRPEMPDVEAFRQSLPEEWRPLVVGPVHAITNGYMTFAFLPDGSKEGWPPSDRGDEYRDAFVELFNHGYSDGSSSFEVTRVRHGGDEPHLTEAVSVMPTDRTLRFAP
jgi:hypothetical protein